MAKSKKRPLTPEEKEMAALIRRTIEGGDKTQDEIAAKIGVTQGAVWQWMKGAIPVSAKAAPKLAAEIGLHPNEISLAYRKVVKDGAKASWPFPRISPDRWAGLSSGEKIRIEGLVLGEIVDLEEKKGSRDAAAHRAKQRAA